jgi:hypothetical protein
MQQLGTIILLARCGYYASSDMWTAAADMWELSGAVAIPAAEPAEEQNLFDALIANATR